MPNRVYHVITNSLIISFGTIIMTKMSYLREDIRKECKWLKEDIQTEAKWLKDDIKNEIKLSKQK